MSNSGERVKLALIKIIKNNPKGSKREHRDTFRSEVDRDLDLRELVLGYAFENRFDDAIESIVVDDSGSIAPSRGSRPAPISGKSATVTPIKPAPPKPYIPRQKPDVSKLMAQLKDVVLMDFLLPGGKKLREATFGECRVFGGWLHDIGMSRPANHIVGNVLTEANLRALAQRHAA